MPPVPTSREQLQTGLPWWFEAGLRVLLSLLLCGSVVGLALAMAGQLRPAAFVVGVLLTGAPLAAILARSTPRCTVGTADHVLAVAVLAGCALFAFWNMRHHGEHLLAERDPGVYVTTGKWLAEEGSLTIDGPQGPFDGHPDLYPAGVGFSPQDEGHLEPQFPHLLPVLLAVGGWLGDRAMLLVNPAVGALSTLLVFAGGARVMRAPWAALGATIYALAFPTVLFVRDAYSEPIATALLFGGLSVLLDRRVSARAGGLLAGGLLGAVCMARIDGFVSLAPLAFVLALMHARSGPSDDGPSRARWVALGVAVTAGLGLVDTWVYSTDYFRTDLQPRLPLMLAAAAAAAIVGLAAAWWLWPDSEPDPGRLRRTVAATLGCAVIALLTLWLRFLRPSLDGIPTFADDATRPILELLDVLERNSLLWLEWYLGPVVVGGGLVGLALMLAVAITGTRPSELVLPGVVLATTLFYLVSPSITPDHPWAMRRFAAVTIPGLALATAWLLGRAWSCRPHRARWAGPVAAAALAPLALLPVVDVTEALADVEPQVPARSLVRWVCDATDGGPTALLVAPHANLNVSLPAPALAWCGVPSAGARLSLTEHDIESLAAGWASEGRRLMLLTVGPAPTFEVAEEQVTVQSFGPFRAPEVTLSREPRHLVPDPRLKVDRDGMIVLRIAEITP